MKTIILAALTVLSLGAGVANAQTYPGQHWGQQSGSYDNTGRGPQQTGLEGGGG